MTNWQSAATRPAYPAMTINAPAPAPPPTAATPPLAEQVAVVILNWKLPRLTADCVAAVQAAGVPAAAIVVVDNGSADDSLTVLRATLDPAVTLLALADNRGFAGGNNVGIAHALAQGAAWVLLLNNDAFVAPDLFAQWADALARDPAPALLAPLIVYADAPQRVWSLGEVRLAGTLLTRDRYRNRRVPADLPPLRYVDFLTACCLLIRRDVLAMVGLFDEQYFVYGEDADFCLRAARAGFRLAVAPAARVRHAVSRSTYGDDSGRLALKLRHQIRFYRTYAPAAERALLALYTLARALAQRPNGALLRVWWQAWRAQGGG